MPRNISIADIIEKEIRKLTAEVKDEHGKKTSPLSVSDRIKILGIAVKWVAVKNKLDEDEAGAEFKDDEVKDDD